MVDPVSISQAASAYGNASRIVEDAATAKPAGGLDEFSSLVAGAINGTVGALQHAEQLSTAAALGKNTDLTALVAAISSAELALTTIVNIRDRAITAYQDIIKMPI